MYLGVTLICILYLYITDQRSNCRFNFEINQYSNFNVVNFAITQRRVNENLYFMIKNANYNTYRCFNFLLL